MHPVKARWIAAHYIRVDAYHSRVIIKRMDHTFEDTHMTNEVAQAERIFMAFADKTRLRLIHLLSNGEVSVNDLCKAAGISQPKVSRHLAYLRSMEIVRARREGKSIYYSLSDVENRFGASLLQDTLEWLDSLYGTIRPTDTPTRKRPTPDSKPVQRMDVRPSMSVEAGERPDEMEIYLL